ncbi:hypothetical protein [Virgibacillus halodenitrificans]|uniref:hypothetical protein n=1 Tax=Virgibacillus halodenitrificans TaxID=1482 RepID=UPI00045D26BD|nr:hypothetical protein [Virgibacillus halodenitrificans]CDQ31873.1 hypothetical protein BN993_01258 [Virgibacillus halodenitrificans]
MNSEKNAFDDETISKAKSVTKSYVQNNYKEVQSTELTEPYINPMGAMTIDGEANNIGFSITINEDFSIAGISEEANFPSRKKECMKEACEY